MNKEKKETPKSDIEWYLEQAQDPEMRYHFEILVRMRQIYRVGFGKMTQDMTELLGRMASTILDYEKEAKVKGLELNPLTVAELQSAYPLYNGIRDAISQKDKENFDEEKEPADKLGLASALRCLKGCSLRVRFRNLRWEIRYAWQRAWRGYDDTDVCDFGFNLVQRIPVLLREFRKRNDTLLRDPMTKRDYTKEETDQIIEKLIFCFENCDEEEVYTRLYGVSSWDDEFNEQRDKWVCEELKECRVEAFRLLSKWCFSLWY